MRRNILRAAAMAGVAACLPAVTVFPAAADDVTAGDLRIGRPWTRAVGERAPTAAGYMAIRNTGSTPDRLLGAESPRATRIELHEMSVTDGVMRMRPLPDGIALPSGDEIRLAPGGLHLMIIGPQGGFVQGTTIPATLIFARAGRVQVELAVQAPGARDAGTADKHSGH